MIQDVRRGAHLQDAAPLHDGDAVADAHGLVQVVGDEHHRALALGLQAQQLVLHLPANQGIKR